MTLNQLRTFLAVAETGSVRAAAHDLVVTQAAVSASLAALQKSLGVTLLEPDGRGLRLTAAGQAYAGYVRGCWACWTRPGGPPPRRPTRSAASFASRR